MGGYTAYTYHGNKDFDMFDSPHANATMNQDGESFFRHLKDDVSQASNSPPFSEAEPVSPPCPAMFLDSVIEDWKAIASYHTGEAGWAKNCPQPYGSATIQAMVV